MKNILLFSLFLLVSSMVFGQFEKTNLKSDTSIYILSCSPGYDLYSVFGHTAIMVKTPTSDWVYNYGTFDFNTDNFYMKFAKGQLSYKLAKEQFGYFQYSYIREQRGIQAQELNLTLSEKRKLIELLEENVLPENALYNYDFFLDNCATRVADIVDEATGNKVKWNTNPNGNGHTFREMIQVYLPNMEWSDLGIDIALGLPCDEKLTDNQQAFLPDSLKYMFTNATLSGHSLVSREFEVLPAEEMKPTKSFMDSTFKVLSLISALIFAVILFFRKSKIGSLVAGIVLFINGLIGLLVFLLWFFTDHGATINNLNILWANPLNLILPFIPKLRKIWLKTFSIILLLTLITWAFLPQDLHESLLPFVALSLLSSLTLGRILNA